MAIIRNYSRYADRTVTYSNLEEFLNSEVLAGINAIPYGHELLELRIVDNKASTTVVLFHAAINPGSTTLPVFIGAQLTTDLEANLIFVSEPALDMGVPIGWFAGDHTRTLQPDLTRAFRHIHEGLSESRNLIFFGASAGGFAALYYSHQFPGSLAVVSNPQTNIEKYQPEHVNIYRERCWHRAELRATGITFDLVPLYADSFPNFVVYLQNRDDTLHMESHFTSWRKAAAHAPDHWRAMIGEWGPGHAPAPIYLLMGVIGFAVEVDGDWAQLFNDEMFSKNG